MINLFFEVERLNYDTIRYDRKV